MLFKRVAWLHQAAWIKQKAIVIPGKVLNSNWTVFILLFVCLFFPGTSTARIEFTLGFNFIKDMKIKAFRRTLFKMEWSCSQFSTLREKQTTFPHSQNHYSLIKKPIEKQTNKPTKLALFFCLECFEIIFIYMIYAINNGSGTQKSLWTIFNKMK